MRIFLIILLLPLTAYADIKVAGKIIVKETGQEIEAIKSVEELIDKVEAYKAEETKKEASDGVESESQGEESKS